MGTQVSGAWCRTNTENSSIHFYKRLPMEKTPSGKMVLATLEKQPICGEGNAELQIYSEILPGQPDDSGSNCENCQRIKGHKIA